MSESICKIEILDNPKEEPAREPSPYNYRCKHCGEPDNIIAYWTATEYGIANLTSLDGDIDDYDTQDSQDLTIQYYACNSCRATADNIEDIAIDPEEWEEEE